MRELQLFFISEMWVNPLYLTPYIQSGDIATAKDLARVTDPLPDLENENIESYAGFLTVAPATNNNMFFWFFPAQVIDTTSLQGFCNLSHRQLFPGSGPC